MNYNYHCHTYRCSHAEPDPEKYILRAIEGGIKYMGFSEHAPLKFENGKQSSYRLPVEQVDAYFEELRALREKYKNKIDIKIGYEMEYYEEYFDRMLADALEAGAEYLILGQHFIFAENREDTVYSGRDTEVPENLTNYVDVVIKAISTGAFTYVAHPEIINFMGDEEFFKSEFRRLCEASKKHGVPLEINFLGIRTKRHYPNEKLVTIMGEVGCPVTFGCDAHGVKDAYDEKSLAVALGFVEKYKLNYIGKPTIRSLKRG